jgi:hypothetical protein
MSRHWPPLGAEVDKEVVELATMDIHRLPSTSGELEQDDDPSDFDEPTSSLVAVTPVSLATKTNYNNKKGVTAGSGGRKSQQGGHRSATESKTVLLRINDKAINSVRNRV